MQIMQNYCISLDLSCLYCFLGVICSILNVSVLECNKKRGAVPLLHKNIKQSLFKVQNKGLVCTSIEQLFLLTELVTSTARATTLPATLCTQCYREFDLELKVCFKVSLADEIIVESLVLINNPAGVSADIQRSFYRGRESYY